PFGLPVTPVPAIRLAFDIRCAPCAPQACLWPSSITPRAMAYGLQCSIRGKLAADSANYEGNNVSTATIEPSTQGRVHVSFKKRYANYIGGKWIPPINGQYFENITPVTGHTLCEVPRSDAADIEAALDAAHAARSKWGRSSPAERAGVL